MLARSIALTDHAASRMSYPHLRISERSSIRIVVRESMTPREPSPSIHERTVGIAAKMKAVLDVDDVGMQSRLTPLAADVIASGSPSELALLFTDYPPVSRTHVARALIEATEPAADRIGYQRNPSTYDAALRLVGQSPTRDLRAMVMHLMPQPEHAPVVRRLMPSLARLLERGSGPTEGGFILTVMLRMGDADLQRKMIRARVEQFPKLAGARNITRRLNATALARIRPAISDPSAQRTLLREIAYRPSRPLEGDREIAFDAFCRDDEAAPIRYDDPELAPHAQTYLRSIATRYFYRRLSTYLDRFTDRLSTKVAIATFRSRQGEGFATERQRFEAFTRLANAAEAHDLQDALFETTERPVKRRRLDTDSSGVDGVREARHPRRVFIPALSPIPEECAATNTDRSVVASFT